MTDTTTTVTPLADKNGVTLERGMRVTTKEGLKAHVGRLDAKSQRAVIYFEDETINPTMRRTNTLAVRKVAGKILFVKEAVKEAKAPKAAKETIKAKVTGKAKKAKAKVEAELPPAVVTIPDAELEPTEAELVAIEAEDLDALVASLPGEAFEV